MPRTLTAQEAVVVEKDDYSVHARVSIKDSIGVFQDFTSLEDRNWVEMVQYACDVDEDVAHATVDLQLDEFGLSLAPLVTTSKFNVVGSKIEAGREVKIETATIPHGHLPSSGDWRLVFHGETEETDTPFNAATGSLRIPCRDLGARLQDRWLEEDGRPGTPPGPPWSGEPTRYAPTIDVLMDTVCQQILDDWAPELGITLYVPVASTFMVKGMNAGTDYGYGPGKVSVLQAMNNLAGQVGWKVRYRWDPNTPPGVGSFRLTLYEPDRAKTSPDKTLAARQILRFGKLSRSRASVRNKIRVTYYTRPGDPTSKAKVVLEDEASKNAYGKRFMGIGETPSSAITHSTEATKLATAALGDLKTIRADAEPEIRYRYDLDIEDLINLQGPTRAYTSDQHAAVVALRHSITRGSAKSHVLVRGAAPAGRIKGWHNKGGFDLRDYRNNSHETARPGTPALTATACFSGAILTVTNVEASSTNFAGIEYHQSATFDFTPSAATLKCFTKANRVEIRGLPFDAASYFKAVLVRRSGVRSAPSTNQGVVPSRLVTNEITDANITTVKIGALQVTEPKMADNAAVTRVIASQAVTEPKLDTAAVSGRTLDINAAGGGLVVDWKRADFTFTAPVADTSDGTIGWADVRCYEDGVEFNFENTNGSPAPTTNRFVWIDLDAVNGDTLLQSGNSLPSPSPRKVVLVGANGNMGQNDDDLATALVEFRGSGKISGDEIYLGEPTFGVAAKGARVTRNGVEATGSDANITLKVRAKGTGRVGIGRTGEEANFLGAGSVAGGFPSSPATNDLYFATNRGILYYYDGTRWLSVAVHTMNVGVHFALPTTPLTVSTNAFMIGATPDAAGGTQILMEKFTCSFFIATTHSTTQYWNVGLSDVSGTNFFSFNTKDISTSANTWIRANQTINLVRTLTSDIQYRINHTKVSTPGGLTAPEPQISYRLVG